MIPQLPLGISPRVSADFDSFYPGSNVQVIADVRACALGQGERFVFLWGTRGSGRSHLLQAGCRSAADLGQACAYIPLADADSFTPDILSDLGSMALVCVDDVQDIAGNPAWEQALFRLFIQLQDSAARLLASADAAPQQLGIGLPDLASRLGWGLSCRLKPLNDEERLALLGTLAARLGLNLPEESAGYILRHTSRDTHSLLALMERLDRSSLAAQRRLTVPFVKLVIEAAGKTP